MPASSRRPLASLLAAALVAAFVAALGLTAPARAEPEKAAVFDFQFSHLSPAPADEAEKARLVRISDELRKLLTESGRYTVVSTEPVKAEVEKSADLRHCNGCAEAFAKTLGAQTAITGEVQKVSNLILNINVYVKPLAADAPERAYSVDIRGSTDESFDRGIRYLVKNELLAPPRQPAQ